MLAKLSAIDHLADCLARSRLPGRLGGAGKVGFATMAPKAPIVPGGSPPGFAEVVLARGLI
eukprot:10756192-Alexandrium_andersonii.AAC.1